MDGGFLNIHASGISLLWESQLTSQPCFCQEGNTEHSLTHSPLLFQSTTTNTTTTLHNSPVQSSSAYCQHVDGKLVYVLFLPPYLDHCWRIPSQFGMSWHHWGSSTNMQSFCSSVWIMQERRPFCTCWRYDSELSASCEDVEALSVICAGLRPSLTHGIHIHFKCKCWFHTLYRTTELLSFNPLSTPVRPAERNLICHKTFLIDIQLLKNLPSATADLQHLIWVAISKVRSSFIK